MRGSDWLAQLGSDAGLGEILDAVRAEHPGRGEAAKYLERELGVSRRSAERYLSGAFQKINRLEIRQAFGRVRTAVQRRIAVARLRRATRLDPGTIKMIISSQINAKPETRTPGELNRMGPGLRRVADLYAQGLDPLAEAALSDCVVARYMGEKSSNTTGAARTFAVVDYSDIHIR